MRPICRNCLGKTASRPRGLCHGCYYTPSIRRRHDPISAFGRAGARAFPGTQDFYGPGKPPPAPTDCLPGSEGKIDVLADRFAARQCLWHPKDAALDNDSLPDGEQGDDEVE